MKKSEVTSLVKDYGYSNIESFKKAVEEMNKDLGNQKITLLLEHTKDFTNYSPFLVKELLKSIEDYNTYETHIILNGKVVKIYKGIRKFIEGDEFENIYEVKKVDNSDNIIKVEVGEKKMDMKEFVEMSESEILAKVKNKVHFTQEELKELVSEIFIVADEKIIDNVGGYSVKETVLQLNEEYILIEWLESNSICVANKYEQPAMVRKVEAETTKFVPMEEE